MSLQIAYSFEGAILHNEQYNNICIAVQRVDLLLVYQTQLTLDRDNRRERTQRQLIRAFDLYRPIVTLFSVFRHDLRNAIGLQSPRVIAQ